MSVYVVTASQAAARDAAAMAAGTPSHMLMRRAGEASAALLLRKLGQRLRESGALVFTGAGNNGGDGWVLAGELHKQGIAVRVNEVAISRTSDARAARAETQGILPVSPDIARPGVVVDALLGTGSRGALRERVGQAVERINAARVDGAVTVALDLPTGVDATTGDAPESVVADLTISFGTVKRGHLIARDRCGEIVVVDIGLGAHADVPDAAPRIVDQAFVASRIPPIGAAFDKGARKRIVIAGGARGMAGAVCLAARSALRSGVGMVRLLVAESSLTAVQASVSEATADTWPASEADLGTAVNGYAHGVLAGPGLGRSDAAADFLRRLLATWRGPTVLDADALNLFAGDLPELRAVLGGRPAILTPHAMECARLMGVDVVTVNSSRFEIGGELARQVGATVLLKGVPTVVSSPDGATLVCARGSPVLATAGSGDLLGGIVTTLLAQTGDTLGSASCAAWVHGRSAELAAADGTIRGPTLADVLSAMGGAWQFGDATPESGVLAAFPAVGDRRF